MLEAAVPQPRAVRPPLVLAVVLVGTFMALLDQFIVNLAVPTIQTDLHTSQLGCVGRRGEGLPMPAASVRPRRGEA